MDQKERRIFLIRELLKERPDAGDIEIPEDEDERCRLLRSLFNIRMPMSAGEELLKVQDAYLREETRQKGITEFAQLEPVRGDIYLWQGDITTLRCDAIVNAANSSLLGCFHPCHGCIDNAIHTFSGIQLRLACNELITAQGYDEETGKAKITPAFNLPCKYVLHTVGPIIYGGLTKNDEALLASCYRSCLELAEGHGVKSIAFCCISTGEFHFPNDRAAETAIETVTEYKNRTGSKMKVIFNVFKDIDFKIYRQLLH